MADSMGQALIDKGWQIREEYSKLLEQKAANRRSLRDLVTQEMLSDEEAAQVAQLYPERKKGDADEPFTHPESGEQIPHPETGEPILLSEVETDDDGNAVLDGDGLPVLLEV